MTKSFAVEDEFSSHNPKAAHQLIEIVSYVKAALLTAIDTDGTLRSRPLHTLDCRPDGTLWFFTDDKAGSIHKFSADPRVNVTYALPDQDSLLSISGLAEVVHDKARRRMLWTPDLLRIFPDGVDGPYLNLLKVYIQKAERWDSASRRLIELLSFSKAIIKGGHRSGLESGRDHFQV